MKLEKTTIHPEGSANRRFEDSCGLAHGLELVGERWALLVLRELLLGPRRFGDLRADLPGISANVLSQRLTELEARGIVERFRLPPPANVQVYGLTDWGRAAEPMILEMARWAMRSPAHDRSLPVSRVAMLLSLKTTLDVSRVGYLSLRLGFRFGDAAYRGRLDRNGIVVESGEEVRPDLAYAGRPRGLAERLYGKVPLADLAARDMLHFTGDPAVEARFGGLFALPDKIKASGPQD